MNTLKCLGVLAGLVLWLLVGCATPRQPYDYQQSNELKPGPGIFTGEEGVYTIYGPPPKEEKEPKPEQEAPANPNAQ